MKFNYELISECQKKYSEKSDAYIRPMFSLISFLKAQRNTYEITPAIVLLANLAGYGSRNRKVQETAHSVQ